MALPVVTTIMVGRMLDRSHPIFQQRLFLPLRWRVEGCLLGDGLKKDACPGGTAYSIGGQYRARYHAERNMRGLGLPGVDDKFLLHRTRARAAGAMTDMLDTINKGRGTVQRTVAGCLGSSTESHVATDYISSENSKGFNAAQEPARILGETIDYSRKTQTLSLERMAEGTGN